MQPIPDDILEQFNAAIEQKSVPVTLRDDYRRWLRYYLDFLVKYPPPAVKSELNVISFCSGNKFRKSTK